MPLLEFTDEQQNPFFKSSNNAMQQDVQPAVNRGRVLEFADDPFEASRQQKPAAPKPERGDFSRGMGTSWEQTKQMVGGTIAYAGDVVGSDSVRQYGLDIYNKAKKNVEEQSKESDEFTNVIAGKGNAIDWFQRTAGYVAGQALEAGAAMVAGAAVGSTALPGGGTIGGAIAGVAGKTAVKAGLKNIAESLLLKEVDRLVKKGLTEEAARAAAAKTVAAVTGAAVATGLNNFVQESGAIYGEANEIAEKDDRRLSGGELARIGGSAGVAAAMDTVIDQAIVGRFFRPKPGGKLIENVVKEGLVLGASNSVTEGLQTAIERFGAGQNLTDAEAIKDYINSMAVGALGGGMAGIASGTVRTFTKEDNPELKFDDVESKQLTPEQLSKHAGALAANGIEDPADPRASKLVRWLEEREASKKGSEDRPTIIAGNEAGNAFEATPGNLAARTEAEARIANSQLPPENREMTDIQKTGLERATDVEKTGQAFDVAAAQAGRAPAENGQDLSAAGTASPEGAAAVEVKPVTFFGAVIKDGQMTSGTQVNVLETGLKVKDAKGIERPASRIAFEDGTEDIVPDNALTTFGRAKQPRFAQEVNERSYAPQEGVGVGSNPAPRFAAQRASVGQTGQTAEQTAPNSPQLPDIDPSLPKLKEGETYVRLYGADVQPGTVAILNKQGSKAKAPGKTFFLGEKSKIVAMPYKATTKPVGTTSGGMVSGTATPANPSQNASKPVSKSISAEVSAPAGTTPPVQTTPSPSNIKNPGQETSQMAVAPEVSAESSSTDVQAGPQTTQAAGKKAGKRTPPKQKKIPVPDETRDSLFVAIAKLGGIRKDDLIGWGVDPRMIGKIPLWRVGYPLARAKGGHSVDGMAEMLIQYGYLTPDQNGKHDLAEFESVFNKELSGTPHYAPSGQQAVDEQRREEAAKDREAAENALLDQDDMEESGYDELSPEEQADVDAIVQNAVEVLGEEEVEAIKERLAMQYPSNADYQKALRNELQARIEAATNPGDVEATGSDAEGQTGTDSESSVEPDRVASGEQGQESFQLDQPTPAELARREMERKNRERQDNAPPSDDFTLTGSSRQADQAAARGQMELTEDESRLRNQLLAAYKKGDLSKDAYDAGIESIDEGDLDYARALIDPEEGLKARLPRGVTIDDATAFKRAVQRKTKKTWNFRPLNDEQAARRVKGYSVLKFIGDRLGVRMVFVENLDPDTYDFEGAYVRSRKNIVFINVNVPTPHMTVFGHEFLHVLRANNESLYQDVKELLLDLTREGKLPQQYKERMVKLGYKNDNEVLTEEFVADVFGDMMTDRKFWDTAMGVNPGLVARIAEKVTDYINSVLERFPGYQTNRYFRDLKAAREVVAQALSDYMQSGDVQQRVKRTEGLAESLRRTVMSEPNFREWFKKSQIKDGEGPKVMYHTTARDISAFTPKQAGAIFVSPNPDFTLRFGKDSESWMVRHADQFFTPQQIERFKRDALAQLKRNQPGITSKELDYFSRNPLDMQEYVEVVTENLPTRANTIPLFVRSEKPFDYESKADVDSVVKSIMAGQRTAKFEGDFNATLEADEVASRLSSGGWTFIENPKVQKAIRELGFDGFYAKEHGVKNLAVYSPNQVKSAIANNGGYSLEMDEIAESKKRDPAKVIGDYTTDSVELRNKSGSPLSGRPTVNDVGMYFDKAVQEKYGRKLDWRNADDFAIALESAKKELAFQLAHEKSGLDWYDEDIKLAFRTTMKHIPSLSQENKRVIFSVMAATMSPQTKANENWSIAAQAMQHYEKTGTVPGRNPKNGALWMGGTTSPNKLKALTFLDRAIKEMGEDAFVQYLMADHPIKELNALKARLGGYSAGTIKGKMDDMVPGHFMFGPKVGPFMMNINGIHEVTVDVWFTRTFNRYFGTMMGPDGEIIDAPTEPQRVAIKRLAREVAQSAGIKDYQVQSVLWFYEQQLFTKLGANSPSYGFSDGAELFDRSVGDGVDTNPGRDTRRKDVRGKNAGEAEEIAESRRRFDTAGLSKDTIAGLDKIDPEPKSIVDRMKEWFQSDRLKQGVFDQFRQIGTYDRKAYLLARMSRAWDGGLETLIAHGKIGFDQDGAVIAKGGKGLIETFKPLEGEVDRFLAWVAANRADKLSQEEREKLFTQAEIRAMKSELNRGNLPSGASRAVVYGNALRDLNELNKSVLDMARQSGLINEEAYAKFSSDIFYVPFYRMMEDGETSSVQSASGLVNQSFSKKLKGGEKALSNLTDNILRNWGMIISASLKNQAADRVFTIASDPKHKVARKIEFWKNKSDNPFVMRNGEKVYYEVDDDLLLDSISAITFSGHKDILSMLAAPMKRIYTRGVTASPFYKLRQIIRDTMSAPAMVKEGYNPLEGAIQRLFSETDANILAGGGVFTMGSSFEGNSKQIMSRLEAMGVKPETILDTPDKIMAVLRQGWKKYDDLGNKLENVNRIGIYQQLRAKGFSHLEASFAARDLQDFSSMGSFAAVRYLTNIVPFLGARVQGLYKLGRSAKENPQRFWTIAGGVMLASIALQAAYKDDDDWKEREEWDRDTYWWFKIGGIAYRIPKPFEIGSMGTLAERLLEQINDEGVEGKVLAERIWAIGTQTFAFNPTPQAIKPILDVYANKDPFTDRPIETLGMERLPKEMRATAGTTAVAKGASNIIGSVADLLGPVGKDMKLSPAQIDYLIRGYFGWLGHTAASIADLPMKVVQDKESPDSRLGDWTGKMVETLPTNSSKFVTMFYKSSQEAAEAYAAVRELRRLGKDAEADELIEEKRDQLRMHRVYSQNRNKLADLNQRIRQINEDAEMTGAEKRSEIDRLSRTRAEIARTVEENRISMRNQ